MPQTIVEQHNNYVREWLAFFNFSNARFSEYFIRQLERHHISRTYNVFKIFDEIKYLEKQTTTTVTKKEAAFKRSPLKGFWHKHHFQDAFIPKNIINHWNLRRKSADKFNDLWQSVILKTGAREMNAEFVNLLAHELVFGAFKNRMRAGDATGE